MHKLVAPNQANARESTIKASSGGGECAQPAPVVVAGGGQHLAAGVAHDYDRGGEESARPAPAIVAAGVGIHLKEPVPWLAAALRLAHTVARAGHPARDSVRVQPSLAPIGVEVQRRGGREEGEVTPIFCNYNSDRGAVLVQCRPEQQLLCDPGPHGTQSHSPPTAQYPHCTAPILHSTQLSPSWPDQKR